MELEHTVERILPDAPKTREEYLLFLRHLFAYESVISYIEQDSEILEVGFGEGYGSRMLSEKAAKVTGVEVEEDTVHYANEKYGSPSCSFVHYNGEQLPFDDEQFDYAVSFQVIEHIEDVPPFLREIRRVLKVDRQCFITTPNRIHRLEPGEEPWNEFHIREYAPQDLEEELANVFTRVEIKGVRGRGAVQDIELRRVSRNLSLYKLLPDFAKRLLHRGFEDLYTTNDFMLVNTAEEGLDLFAICTK
ncbi:MAG: class I SAM-dependent methyltransferase [Balneolaceae bacterium]|nr:class I SAM-dependent methyltransferase [Balneolaceae bacterium]